MCTDYNWIRCYEIRGLVLGDWDIHHYTVNTRGVLMARAPIKDPRTGFWCTAEFYRNYNKAP